jgi:hypothetical protein
MPFDREFDDVYRLGIKAAAEEKEIHAERVDEQVFHKEGILERIYSQISAADIIIADMTGRNPNVFYEVGFAHAKGKYCILLTKSVNDIPFDLKHHRHIIYENISQLKTLLISDLSAISDILKMNKNAISVEMNVGRFGDLELKSYGAEGSYSIKFDIHSNFSSTLEIDALYLYTGEDWVFKQNDRECPHTKSDIDGYVNRHLIELPIKRFSKGTWAQANVVGKKMIEWAKKDQLKNSYKLVGKIGAKAITTEGVHEFSQKCEIEFTEFPF